MELRPGTQIKVSSFWAPASVKNCSSTPPDACSIMQGGHFPRLTQRGRERGRGGGGREKWKEDREEERLREEERQRGREAEKEKTQRETDRLKDRWIGGETEIPTKSDR